MKSVVFSFPGNELLGEQIMRGLGAEKGEYILRSFPDKETYVRILSDVKEKSIIIVCELHEPNEKLLPLFFLCKLLRELQVTSICLVAPYLAYMRQDKKFNPGEAVTSAYFATLISSFTDRLITVDPHLHRRANMNEIYSIPCEVLHAARPVSDWIKMHVPDAVLIGPDEESEQWVSEIAKDAGIPFIVLKKERHGDRDVEVSVPQVEKYKNHVPVLVDDIISTARTMIETLKHLQVAGMAAPICIGVHAVFAQNSYQDLKEVGAKRIVTCNTIQHETNAIDISNILIECLKSLKQDA